MSLTHDEPDPPHLDADLATRIRSGDAAAFDTLFRAYYGQLCSFACTYTGSPDTAEEIVQDVFTAIWARRAQWTVTVSARAYLYGAVRNRAQRRRAQARAEQVRWSLLATDQALESADAEDRLERGEVEAIVRRAIDRLPERSRIVATLRWQRQLSHPEIAAVMGISVKGVENQLTRVAKRLRVFLAQLRSPA